MFNILTVPSYIRQSLRELAEARAKQETMAKQFSSTYGDDIELGESSSTAGRDSAKMERSSSSPPEASKSEEKGNAKEAQASPCVDVWSEIANEYPPTYQDQLAVYQSQLSPFMDPPQLTQCPGDMHISYNHYAALILFIGFFILFCIAMLLYRAEPAVVINGLSTVAASACPTTAPQINVEPHFFAGSGEGGAANMTTITVYQTFTETTTAISTVFSTIETTSTQTQGFPATVQGNSSTSAASATLVSTITQFSTVTLTPSLQTPSTVIVTSTKNDCSSISSAPPPPATTLTTTVKAQEPSIKPSTRYFTGPNKVGSIIGGP
jgi:hypothetical protein